jgi:hypothetical protein
MTTFYIDPQTIHNPATGTSPPASWGDSVRDGLEFCAKPPGAVVNRTATQSITSNTWTSIAFNATDLRDSDAFHDTATNNTRLTIPTGFGGWYEVGASVVFGVSTSATGRAMRVLVNGATDYRLLQSVNHGGGTATAWEGTASRPLLLSAGDYCEIQVWHSVSSNLDLSRGQGWVRLVAVS